MSDYLQFLEAKMPKLQLVGFEPTTKMNGNLFPFQQHIVRWALKLGRAAIFADTGLGKTLMQLEWAHHVVHFDDRPVLILCPLAVAAQTVREAKRFGIKGVKYCSEQSEVEGSRIVVTNYERLEKFDPFVFAGVVLDECFAAGTLVDLVSNDGHEVPTPIERVKVGDRIRNASGIDVVSDVHRREVTHAVRVTAAGSALVASPNHPFFTQRGWVGAQDLRPGDRTLVAAAAVSLVRDNLRAEVPGGLRAEVLRSVLLSEMADGSTGASSESPHAADRGEEGQETLGMVQVRNAGRECGDRADTGAGEGRSQPRDTREDLPPIARDEARTFRAWGQRSWFDRTPADFAGCTRVDVGAGVQLVTGPTDSGLSHALQARLGEARTSAGNRGGWELAPQPEGARREEGCEAAFARVDRVEVLEPGHPDLECLRSADGKLYFFDLGGTRHPSFSVGGLLVHNSSVLKSFMGKTKRALVDAFEGTRFKLCCTATPSPNDVMELGNHCEFLGVMSSHEMLARFFINDSMNMGTYRLKGHAEADFWRWVVSWAACVASPSDLFGPDGQPYDATGYVLPQLQLIEHAVEGPSAEPPEGELVAVVNLNATTIYAEARRTAEVRAARAAELVAAEPDEQWLIWCNTNYEADELRRVLPDAIEIRGNDTTKTKEQAALDFADGKIRVMVSKGSIFGLGLNFQGCARMAFVGLNYSFEQFYQSLRRSYRFGQKREVHAHIICAKSEMGVRAAIAEKQEQHRRLQERMVQVQREAQAQSTSVDLHHGDIEMRLPPWLEGSAS